MIRVPPQSIDHIRAAQETLLNTKGGSFLLGLVMELGNVNRPLDTDEQRVEFNLARRLLRDSGIELVPKRAELVVLPSPDENLIDREVGSQGDPEDVGT